MAKTLRNEYDKNLSYENIMKAHLESRKGKNLRREMILFNLKQEEYVMWLYLQLKNMTYRHGGYTSFYVKEPKIRKIEKSKYIDRIVHRWYVDSFMKKYFVTQFISTSYACITGKGMHRACLDLQAKMKHCKRIWNNYYILKMDVAKYFQNINKKILIEILSRKIKDEKVMWITKQIVYSGNKELGLPIGNYTSQIFANIYLNEVDQYIKKILKIKYYFRYMDDSVLLVKTKQEAIDALEKITKFLSEKLDLKLNKKTQIFKSKQGVNFCGYKINEYRIKLRDKGKRKFKNKVKKLKLKIKNGNLTSKEAKKYLCGHFGYIKYANVYNLKNSIL